MLQSINSPYYFFLLLFVCVCVMFLNHEIHLSDKSIWMTQLQTPYSINLIEIKFESIREFNQVNSNEIHFGLIKIPKCNTHVVSSLIDIGRNGMVVVAVV